jgi:transcriptional regulator with XRE-family HTH domain
MEEGVLAIASETLYHASGMKTPQLGDVGSFIREQRERSALSIRKLAELTGVSNPYLSQIERGVRTPSAEILRSIAGALSIRTETLYERAGLLERDDPPGVVDAIDADAKLTDTQKKALMEIYTSFIAHDQEGS